MKYLLIILLALSMTSFSYAADTEETIELTTYYPAPYGEYEELGASYIDFNNTDYQTASPANTPNIAEGRLFYDTNDGKFKYSSDGINWKPISSIGSSDGFDYTNAGDGRIQLYGSEAPAASFSMDYTPPATSPNSDFFIKKAGTNRILIGGISTRIFSYKGSGASETELKVGDGRVDVKNATLRVNGKVKSFVIEHPSDPSKYLVHGCIEGPEAAVYYRGQAKLIDSEAKVTLPNYFEALTKKESRTIQLTPKGENPFVLSCSDISDGSFEVYASAKEGEFFWEVKAIRSDVDTLEIEPDKDSARVRGFGPYTYTVSK